MPPRHDEILVLKVGVRRRDEALHHAHVQTLAPGLAPRGAVPEKLHEVPEEPAVHGVAEEEDPAVPRQAGDGCGVGEAAQGTVRGRDPAVERGVPPAVLWVKGRGEGARRRAA